MLESYGVKQPGDGIVRVELPAGPPAGRARRAVHPALPPRLGPPRRRRTEHAIGRPKDVDQPTAALIQDLKQRGMLDDTLVIWGGEFGRTPMGQGDRPRPPHPGLLALAGRRRHQGRHHLRRDRRARLPAPSRTSCTSTTCTPRCCTSAASTTSG